MIPPEEIRQLTPLLSQILPTGSRFVCSPPVMDTDEDYICLAATSSKFDFMDVMGALQQLGYEQESKNYDVRDKDHVFKSFRKGDVNLIVTESDLFFQRFCAATRAARALNLDSKGDRVALFQAILYGEGV